MNKVKNVWRQNGFQTKFETVFFCPETAWKNVCFLILDKFSMFRFQQTAKKRQFTQINQYGFTTFLAAKCALRTRMYFYKTIN